jgi:polyhydroxyalkanoate synthase
MESRIRFSAEAALREMAETGRKLADGVRLLGEIKEDDVRIATTPKDEVMRRDKTVLYRYRRVATPSVKLPVLVAYGLIGRYTMADLQDDRSLIRNLLAQGVDVYAVDWGNPSRSDRWLTLEDYVDGYLGDCVDHIRAAHGVDAVNLLGICEGGVFTLCYAALHPRRVRNLAVTITPVDFHADMDSDRIEHGFINLWTRSLAPADIDRIVDAFGYVPGKFMGMVFSMMTPVKSLTKYNLDMLDVFESRDRLMNFLRMEKWLADRPHHPGEAAKQWFKELYQENRLVKGEFTLGGRRVDLAKVTMPVLNVYALEDHIIPPGCSKALGGVVGSKDYTEIPLPGGHVGVFVSGKSQGIVAKGIVGWLRDRP